MSSGDGTTATVNCCGCDGADVRNGWPRSCVKSITRQPLAESYLRQGVRRLLHPGPKLSLFWGPRLRQFLSEVRIQETDRPLLEGGQCAQEVSGVVLPAVRTGLGFQMAIVYIVLPQMVGKRLVGRCGGMVVPLLIGLEVWQSSLGEGQLWANVYDTCPQVVVCWANPLPMAV